MRSRMCLRERTLVEVAVDVGALVERLAIGNRPKVCRRFARRGRHVLVTLLAARTAATLRRRGSVRGGKREPAVPATVAKTPEKVIAFEAAATVVAELAWKEAAQNAINEALLVA